MAFCPKKVFQKSKERNASGVAIPVAARAELCVACRLCERYCPDAAIRVTPIEAEPGQTRTGSHV
jgi:2-oxoglutarate ferredoxin oxidoreductase subunit delta